MPQLTLKRPTPPTPEVVYGRQILAEAALMIRDGAIGGAPGPEISGADARRIQAEIAGWFDFVAGTLRSVAPSGPGLKVERGGGVVHPR